MDKVEHSPQHPRYQSYDSGFLPVTDGHSLYYEQAGNPAGVTVVCLHGGPGAGSNAWTRRFFDLDHYRVIQFDQRGAGKSTPSGSLDANTTAHLIADIEALRHALNIDQWLVFGGSWGATLALAYLGAHETSVRGVILRGLFLGRAADRQWFLDGLKQFYPDAHADWLQALPESLRAEPLEGYRQQLNSRHQAVRLAAGSAWANYEAACSSLAGGSGFGKSEGAWRMARLEAHYLAHHCFFEDTRAGALSAITAKPRVPGILVHGRFDMICPLEGAFALKARWPDLDLRVIQQAGHSAGEPAIAEALSQALERAKAW
ncbi:MAG: prolyl aminopeptidase [Alphaproteobacteria bacterium TMED89]|nr:prolyl aminopeptidase [Rhodospirillaceae bacterium]RPH16852.1 MAG: prolyl aminopeptidase [Alphaproteobacteria bacterium TMED89]